MYWTRITNYVIIDNRLWNCRIDFGTDLTDRWFFLDRFERVHAMQIWLRRGRLKFKSLRMSISKLTVDNGIYKPFIDPQYNYFRKLILASWIDFKINWELQRLQEIDWKINWELKGCGNLFNFDIAKLRMRTGGLEDEISEQ